MVDPRPPELTADEARAYEALFVPALFGPWAGVVADAAGLRPGQRVLDVACGTGVLARTARARVQPGGSVVGLDAMRAMLAVAGEIAPQIEWRHGLAEALPLPDDAFDVVVSQFGLMFFADPARALREMMRVLRSGGRLTVAVWGSVDRTPAYVAYTALLERLFGTAVADRLRAPFVLGAPGAFSAVVAAAGIASPVITTREGLARFPSLRAFVDADARGWLQLDDRQCQTLHAAAPQALGAFVSADGSVAFPMPAHVVTAVKP